MLVVATSLPVSTSPVPVMPANLTPQYRAAEEEYRSAVTVDEKVRCTENMIRMLPKHKGTDHLFGQLKRRLSKLKNEGGKKSSRRSSAHLIPKEGAAQLVLLGAPNVGKSQIMRALTRAHAEVAEYPFSTHTTMPGMMLCKDIQIQLIDTPPLSEGYMETWMPDVVRRADAALVVVDLGSDDALEQAEAVFDRLATLKIVLQGELPTGEDIESRVTYRRSMLLGNKCDLPDAEERLAIIRELYSERMPVLSISATEGRNLDEFREAVLGFLRLVRVYTRVPGRKGDTGEPFALPAGSTVRDLAGAIHKELQDSVGSARIWGENVYDGQHVKLDHVLCDGDIIELHELSR